MRLESELAGKWRRAAESGSRELIRQVRLECCRDHPARRRESEAPAEIEFAALPAAELAAAAGWKVRKQSVENEPAQWVLLERHAAGNRVEGAALALQARLDCYRPGLGAADGPGARRSGFEVAAQLEHLGLDGWERRLRG